MQFKSVVSPEGSSKELDVLESLKVDLVDNGVEIYVKAPLLYDWVSGRMEDPGQVAGNAGEEYRPAVLPPEWNWRMEKPDYLDTQNMFWLLHPDLKEGARITIEAPAMCPSEFNDYVHAMCENVSRLYSRYVRKSSVSGRLSVVL